MGRGEVSFAARDLGGRTGGSPLCGAPFEGVGTIGALGFGAAAWACAPRDTHIGWDPATRKANLHLIAGNARFLILPHVRVPSLASAILARAARQLPADWQERYGYAPVLLETFAGTNRFTGASYRAANWTWAGYTKGRGKLDRGHQHAQPVKDVYLYPLQPGYQRILTNRCGVRTRHGITEPLPSGCWNALTSGAASEPCRIRRERREWTLGWFKMGATQIARLWGRDSLLTSAALQSEVAGQRARECSALSRGERRERTGPEGRAANQPCMDTQPLLLDAADDPAAAIILPPPPVLRDRSMAYKMWP
jgi:hypothetical protein